MKSQVMTKVDVDRFATAMNDYHIIASNMEVDVQDYINSNVMPDEGKLVLIGDDYYSIGAGIRPKLLVQMLEH